MTELKKRHTLGGGMVVLAVLLLWPIYQAPVWWVSLDAPNYPREIFPEGIRIVFHLNGVFNGCAAEEGDGAEGETVDCAQEMDTINHYVGMYPIAAGGPVELFFSLFLLGLIGVMLVAHVCPWTKVRLAVMVLGFAGVAVWMAFAFYGEGGLRYHNGTYLAGRITALGEVAGEEPAGEALSPGEAVIARLKASLAASEAAERGDDAVEPAIGEEGAARSIAHLRDAFEQDRNRVSTAGQEWRGSGLQLLTWHYEKSLGRYFRDEAVLGPMVARMVRSGHVVFWAVVVLMVALVFLARRPGGLWDRLLILVPAGLPLFFVVEYSAWLWWYGHNMSEMGAFTLKPFMPTVFGQGKVAQFTTNSYPDAGFWLMLLFAALLVGAAMLRRKPADSESAD